MKVAGVSYEINWRAFTKGKSMFFPCLDPKAAWRDMRPTLAQLRINVVRRSVIDPISSVRGLRIWRI